VHIYLHHGAGYTMLQVDMQELQVDMQELQVDMQELGKP